MKHLTRRQFVSQSIQWSGASLALMAARPWPVFAAAEAIPSYLEGYEKLYAQDPAESGVGVVPQRQLRPVHALRPLFAAGQP
jgi:hypothetical protein